MQTHIAAPRAALSPEAVVAQLDAIAQFGGQWDRLDEIKVPVVVANGPQVVMIDVDATIRQRTHDPVERAATAIDSNTWTSSVDR